MNKSNDQFKLTESNVVAHVLEFSSILHEFQNSKQRHLSEAQYSLNVVISNNFFPFALLCFSCGIEDLAPRGGGGGREGRNHCDFADAVTVAELETVGFD